LLYVAGVLRSNQAHSLGSAMKRSLLITFVVVIGKYRNTWYKVLLQVFYVLIRYTH